MYLKGKQDPDINLEVLARHTAGLSGADLFNIANWAAIEAIKVGRERGSKECRKIKAYAIIRKVELL